MIIRNREKLAALLALVCISASGGAGAEGTSAVPEPPAAVRVIAVQSQLKTIPIRSSGRVRYGEVRSLSFKVSGFVETLSVGEGQSVRAGQVLARLDPAVVDAGLKRALATADKRRADVKRMRQLRKQKLISADTLELAEQALVEARAALQIARHDKKHAVILAPEDGVVVSRPLDAGEYAQPGQTVLEVAPRLAGWVVRFGLSDRDLVRLRTGDAARIELDAWRGLVVSGRVTELATRAQNLSGIFEVEVTLENPPANLRDGFFARVELLPDSVQPFHFLPLTTLTGISGDRAEVVVIDGEQRVRRRSIRVRHLLSDEIAVSSGLQNGDRVVLEGGGWLQSGERVSAVTDYKLAVR